VLVSSSLAGKGKLEAKLPIPWYPTLHSVPGFCEKTPWHTHYQFSIKTLLSRVFWKYFFVFKKNICAGSTHLWLNPEKSQKRIVIKPSVGESVIP